MSLFSPIRRAVTGKPAAMSSDTAIDRVQLPPRVRSLGSPLWKHLSRDCFFSMAIRRQIKPTKRSMKRSVVTFIFPLLMISFRFDGDFRNTSRVNFALKMTFRVFFPGISSRAVFQDQLLARAAAMLDSGIAHLSRFFLKRKSRTLITFGIW